MERPFSRRDVLLRASRAAAVAPLLGLAACGRGAGLAGRTMGTTYAVTIPDLPAGITAQALQEVVERILRTVDRQMSTYRPDSELSRFNAGPAGVWHPVSVDTLAVVERALRIGRLTAGAFDATLGALVHRWGFGPPLWHARAGAEGLARAYGPDALRTRAARPALLKRQAGLVVDLSGIAKGFGLDRICALLDGLGIADYLIEIGGELRGRGRRADGTPWRVGIARPLPGATAVQRVVRLEDRALATAGDYLDFYDRGGRRYSHIIDPRSGEPVSHGLASVTVMAATAMEADALATALMVLGPVAGPRLARDRGVAALFMQRDGAGFAETATPDFRPALIA